MSECNGLLSEVWINTVQNSEEFNLTTAIIYLITMRECDGLLSEVWINTVQHSEELICNIFRRPKGQEGIAIQYQMLFTVQLSL